MYYYLYRFYDPNLQRWINRDPAWEWGAINLYLFAINQPVNWIDSDGREIAYANHLVVNPYYRSKIVITPDDQSRYADDPRFSQGGRKW